MKNGASASQGRKTGTYQRKEVFGKLPYWTSKNYAIWYNSKAKAWAIGTLASLGTNSQGILGIKGEFRWPFDKKYRWMYYKIGSGWMKTARNDITVKCKGRLDFFFFLSKILQKFLGSEQRSEGLFSLVQAICT